MIRLAFKNLAHRPLTFLLSWLLLLFGVGIIALLLLVQQQTADKFDRDLKDIDLVIGAKGSPLQLVLSAVYHVDAPTGNIRLADAKQIMDNGLVEQAIPLAYGDNFQGYSIVGTDSNYLSKYEAVFAAGHIFHDPMEVVMGANVARLSRLGVDSLFYGVHGSARGGHVHKEHAYKIVGVLRPTGSVLDNLVLTPVSSVYLIHQHADHDDDGDEDATAHEPELTAVLLKFRSPMAIMTLPRMINASTGMQAASPALEINRMMGLLGIGITTLQYIAVGIVVLAGLSVFISLYSRLRERSYDMALLRCFGYTRQQLFLLVLLESAILAILGFISGWILSRIGMYALNEYAGDELHMDFRLFFFSATDLVLALGTMAMGILAALIPAIKLYTLDISKTLSHAA